MPSVGLALRADPPLPGEDATGWPGLSTTASDHGHMVHDMSMMGDGGMMMMMDGGMMHHGH